MSHQDLQHGHALPHSKRYHWVHRALQIAVLLSAFHASALLANEDRKWYEIEILIFSNNNLAAATEENWPVFRESWVKDESWELIPRQKQEISPEDLQDLTEIDPQSSGARGQIRTLEELREEQARIQAEEDARLAAENRGKATTDAEAPPEDKQAEIRTFDQLLEEDLQLVGLAEKIARSSDYNLLLHTGWRQPVNRGGKKTPVYLDEFTSSYMPDEEAEAEKPGSPEEALLDTLLEQSQRDSARFAGRDASEGTVMAGSMPAPEDMEGPPQSIIHGTANLKLARFLHLNLNLVYRAPEEPETKMDKRTLNELFPMLGENAAEPEPEVEIVMEDEESALDEPPLNGYELNLNRRVKTRELHYFDHPRFAAIVRLLPYEPPEEEQAPRQSPAEEDWRQGRLGQPGFALGFND